MNIPKVKRPSEEIVTRIQALKEKKGLIAAIEPDTGVYFLGKTLTEALKKAKEKYPDKIFYSIRIGYTFVHEHKGGLKKI